MRSRVNSNSFFDEYLSSVKISDSVPRKPGHRDDREPGAPCPPPGAARKATPPCPRKALAEPVDPWHGRPATFDTRAERQGQTKRPRGGPAMPVRAPAHPLCWLQTIASLIPTGPRRCGCPLGYRPRSPRQGSLSHKAVAGGVECVISPCRAGGEQTPGTQHRVDVTGACAALPADRI